MARLGFRPTHITSPDDPRSLDVWSRHAIEATGASLLFLPALQPRLQSDRECLRQAEGAAQSSCRENRRRLMGQDRQSPRLPHPTRMRQLLRRRWIRRNLIGKGSSRAARPHQY